MSRVDIPNFKRSLATSLRHAREMYAQRPISFWYKKLRKYELALECLQEYEERAGK